MMPEAEISVTSPVSSSISQIPSYRKLSAFILCVLPVLAALLPRFFAVIPVITALVLLLSYRRLYGHWPKFYRPAFIWMGALSALMAISALWSIDPAVSLERTVKMFPVLMGGAMLFSLARVCDGDWFRRWLPFGVLLALAACIFELYTHGALYHLFHPVPGPGTEDNLFYLNRGVAAIMLMLFPALACVRISNWAINIKITFYTIFFIGALAALYKTDSQSAQLAVLFALPFYLIFPVRWSKAWLGISIMLTALIFATPWLAQYMYHSLPPVAQESAFLQRGFALNRLEIWDFIARRALERPLLGHGVEATRVIKDFDSAMLYQPSREILHPHNFALQLWIEFGILGPLYAVSFFAMLMRGIRNWEPFAAHTALAVLFGGISVASTGYGLWQAMWIGIYGVLFCFCMLVAQNRPPENEKA